MSIYKKLIYYFTVFLIGFILINVLLGLGGTDKVILNQEDRFDYLSSVWARGDGIVFDLDDDQMLIKNDNFKHSIIFDQDPRISINPKTEQEEARKRAEEEADNCSEIDFNYEEFMLQEATLDDVELNDEASYFLTFRQEKGDFIINHLIIKK